MKTNLVIAALLVLSVGGCRRSIDTGDTTKQEMEATEKNQERLLKAVPAPQLNDSLERRNLVKYLEYWNDPNRISYIYLISYSGSVVGYHAIVGKVTYCSSKLTTRHQIMEVGRYSVGKISRHVVESPGFDGSYGPSEDAIFFFTQENPDVPVIWKGFYFVSGVPMKLAQQPILVREVSD